MERYDLPTPPPTSVPTPAPTPAPEYRFQGSGRYAIYASCQIAISHCENQGGRLPLDYDDETAQIILDVCVAGKAEFEVDKDVGCFAGLTDDGALLGETAGVSEVAWHDGSAIDKQMGPGRGPDWCDFMLHV